MTRFSSPTPNTQRWLIAIVVLALLLRLAVGLSQDHAAPYTSNSADGFWYLNAGLELVRGDDFAHLPTAPIYMLFAGFSQQFFPGEGAIVLIRIIQALLGATTCVFAYRLARLLSGTPAGLLAAGIVAVSPVFIIEAAQVATETLYLFLLGAGMTIYVAAVANRHTNSLWPFVWAAILFAAATLTRAVPLLFPLGLAVHLLLVYGRRGGLKRAAVLLVAYALMVSTWTVYNVVRFDRWIVGAEGLAAFLYIGSTGYTSPQDVDARLSEDATEAVPDDATYEERQQAYVEAAANVIGSDPLGYLRRRVGELAGAYLQPHGTTFFPGESQRVLLMDWLRTDRSLAGLVALTQANSFWPKLVMYVFHYVGLVAGLAGMWLYRHQWRVALPMIGFIIYTSLVHLVLLALPRYIFPTALFWWVFAAAALAGRPVAQPAPTLTEPAQTRI